MLTHNRLVTQNITFLQKMGGRLDVYFENHLKLDLFSKFIYILKEEVLLHLFYNKNSVLMFFRNDRFLEEGLNVERVR